LKRSPVTALNKALYTRLKNIFKTPVYDFVPVGKKPPYIVLTDTQTQNWQTKTIEGAVVSATIKIISDYQGDKEVAELADKIILAINKASLELSDAWQIVLFNLDSYCIERLETQREATIILRFTIIDTKE
jgi:hypothetical protein